MRMTYHTMDENEEMVLDTPYGQLIVFAKDGALVIDINRIVEGSDVSVWNDTAQVWTVTA